MVASFHGTPPLSAGVGNHFPREAGRVIAVVVGWSHRSVFRLWAAMSMPQARSVAGSRMTLPVNRMDPIDKNGNLVLDIVMHIGGGPTRWGPTV